MHKTKWDFHYAIKYCKKTNVRSCQPKWPFHCYLDGIHVSGRKRRKSRIKLPHIHCIIPVENIGTYFKINSNVCTTVQHNQVWYEPRQTWYWYEAWSWHTTLFDRPNICWRRDGTVNLMSECEIHSPERLQVRIVILLNSLVIFGTAAEGLLKVTWH